ncbi:hypothetical protein FN846DRAFT_404255 [Sphaerosporella brunnea]|uniref:Uncharacterized protein n=1 Tax=Sphaerosporella brunnea TaxID=1250544 RepID=A0A5J5F508_9PEZI|nr:hypothetical protein FN846DRAFT_404255 [Sphaerosporella brunnea]
MTCIFRDLARAMPFVSPEEAAGGVQFFGLIMGCGLWIWLLDLDQVFAAVAAGVFFLCSALCISLEGLLRGII